MFAAVFCSFLYNTASCVEPIATLSNLSFGFHVQLITLDTTYRYLPSWATVFLYGATALFLREERSNFRERFSSFSDRMQLVVESVLFSSLLILLSVNAGLNVGDLVKKGASNLLVFDHGFPGAITWASQVIWVLTAVELFLSAGQLKRLKVAYKAECENGVVGIGECNKITKVRMMTL